MVVKLVKRNRSEEISAEPHVAPLTGALCWEQVQRGDLSSVIIFINSEVIKMIVRLFIISWNVACLCCHALEDVLLLNSHNEVLESYKEGNFV